MYDLRPPMLEEYGVIQPEAHAAVQATRNRKLGLMATQATVDGGRYRDYVAALDAGVELVARPCPGLVPLIEGEDPFGAETTEAVREYAEPLKRAAVDTVILGCTHYPLIKPVFQRVFGRGVTLVFSAEETAREVAETLARKGIERQAYRSDTMGNAPASVPDCGAAQDTQTAAPGSARYHRRHSIGSRPVEGEQ